MSEWKSVERGEDSVEWNRFKGVFVSRDGKILNKYGARLSWSRQQNGYHFVFIKNRKVYVHRLVLETYTYPNSYRYDIYNEVDHIDGNKDNNHISNLRWVNRKLNLCNRRQVEPVLHAETGKWRFCLAYSPVFVHADKSEVQKVINQFYTRYFDEMKSFYDASPRAWLGETHNAYIRARLISQSDYCYEKHSQLVLNYAKFPVTDAYYRKYAQRSD